MDTLTCTEDNEEEINICGNPILISYIPSTTYKKSDFDEETLCLRGETMNPFLWVATHRSPRYAPIGSQDSIRCATNCCKTYWLLLFFDRGKGRKHKLRANNYRGTTTILNSSARVVNFSTLMNKQVNVCILKQFLDSVCHHGTGVFNLWKESFKQRFTI